MRQPERKALHAFYGGIVMEESLLNKAFRLAPLTSAAGIAYGLEHAPKFTINLLNGLLFAAATDYHAQLEDQAFAHLLSALMATCGPWRYGPETASQSRVSLERLPASDPAVTLLDPYYFDHSMVYSDDGYREGDSQLFTHAYRLHPCGVFALNYDPRRDDDSTLGRVGYLHRIPSRHRSMGQAVTVQRDVARGASAWPVLCVRDAAMGHFFDALSRLKVSIPSY